MNNIKFLILCLTIVALYGIHVWGQRSISEYRLNLTRAETVRDAIKINPKLMTGTPPGTPMTGIGGPEEESLPKRKGKKRWE